MPQSIATQPIPPCPSAPAALLSRRSPPSPSFQRRSSRASRRPRTATRWRGRRPRRAAPCWATRCGRGLGRVAGVAGRVGRPGCELCVCGAKQGWLPAERHLACLPPCPAAPGVPRVACRRLADRLAPRAAAGRARAVGGGGAAQGPGQRRHRAAAGGGRRAARRWVGALEWGRGMQAGAAALYSCPAASLHLHADHLHPHCTHPQARITLAAAACCCLRLCVQTPAARAAPSGRGDSSTRGGCGAAAGRAGWEGWEGCRAGQAAQHGPWAKGLLQDEMDPSKSPPTPRPPADLPFTSTPHTPPCAASSGAR